MENINIVHLRQPNNKPDEMRSDPFWEFGSFGITGCHCKNILHKNNYSKLKGNRLAFAQNGKDGFKMVMLTPPVSVIQHKKLYEVTWDNKVKPFKYKEAPLIINNNGDSEFPLLLNSFRKVKRNSYVAQFSSAFRTRCKSLSKEIAEEVLEIYKLKLKNSIKSDFIINYTDALPYNPPKEDKDRKSTYKKLLNNSTKDEKQVKSKSRKC